MQPKHQHYVPRLLLKGFLKRDTAETKSERVAVLDLETGSSFTTSVDNIMGESRYNDFWIDDDTLGSIEKSATRIENYIAPMVRRLRLERRLNLTLEEHDDLSLLMAFQFLRTKKMRLLPERLDAQLRAHIVRRGWDPAKVDGIVDWDEDKLKREHLRQQVRSLKDFTRIFRKKVFFLMTAPEGSSFYIGDNPVVMHSDQPRRAFSGLGIDVPYIQIYLPLSADVMLCAYCPGVLGNLMRLRDEGLADGQSWALRALMDGRLTPSGMKAGIEAFKQVDIIGPMVETIRAGEEVAIGRDEVRCYNSLQAFHAHRFVIDPDGRFDVAREMIAERAASNVRESRM